MSRIGKKPIELPAGVQIAQEAGVVKVSGPNGQLSEVLPPGIEFSLENSTVVIKTTGR